MGASVTFAFAPFNQWWLPFIILSAWFCIQSTCKEHSFKSAWLFSFGYFSAGISWVHVSIADHGGVPLLVSIAMMAVLTAYLAVFPALSMWIAQRYFKKQYWPLILPFIWLMLEWLRAHFMTGFPWLSLGYSQINGPLGGWIPLVGEIGVSAILILISVSIGVSLSDGVDKKHQDTGTLRSGFQSLLVAIVFLVSGVIFNNIDWVTPKGEPKQISMVQGNIEQTVRWVPEQDRPTMQKYWNLTEGSWGSDLIIWPEAAVPKLEIAATGFLQLLDDTASQNNTAIITGIVDYDYSNEKVYNSLLSLGNDLPNQNTLPYEYQHANRFSKHHLLPIGEFVPFEGFLRKLAPIFDLPMSSFTRGNYVQANLLANGMSLAPAICFEIAFPNQISANLTNSTDAIITVSNDAWFGDSHGPHQHLQIAQMRAKEFGLPVLRSTNNGVTAFVDHKGAISAIAPQFEDTVLTEDVQLVSGKTPYRQFGNMPSYLAFACLFLLGVVFSKRSKTV